jgi:hypothetical protein
MTTVKKYLVENKAYKGYMITKGASNLNPSSASRLTNSRQALVLTNCDTGITKEFSTHR